MGKTIDDLDKKLLGSIVLIFIVSTIYLYIFSILMGKNPATELIMDNPWAVYLLGWDVAVFLSVGQYWKAWENKMHSGRLFK